MSIYSFLCIAIAPALLVRGLEVRQAHQALDEQFAEYVRKYQKEYSAGAEEYSRRKAHYTRTAAEVERLNSRPGRLWTAGTGPLADRSEEELQSMRGWFGSARRAHFTSSLAQARYDMCQDLVFYVVSCKFMLMNDMMCVCVI